MTPHTITSTVSPRRSRRLRSRPHPTGRPASRTDALAGHRHRDQGAGREPPGRSPRCRWAPPTRRTSGPGRVLPMRLPDRAGSAPELASRSRVRRADPVVERADDASRTSPGSTTPWSPPCSLPVGAGHQDRSARPASATWTTDYRRAWKGRSRPAYRALTGRSPSGGCSAELGLVSPAFVDLRRLRRGDDRPAQEPRCRPTWSEP